MLQFRSLFASLTAPSASEDIILWATRAIKFVKTSLIWDSIRSHAQKVPWAKLLWHSHHIPQFFFTMWLALRRRLPTNDRFSSYSSFRPLNCPFYETHVETFSHLFFDCTYSAAALSSVLVVGGWSNVPMRWDDLVDFIIQFRGSTIRSNILKLVFASAVYKIWAAMNSLVHDRIKMPLGVLVRDILNVIKSRPSSSSKFLLVAQNHLSLRVWL